MIIAIDEGYTFMKIVYGESDEDIDIFKSTVKEGYADYGFGMKVEFEGKNYSVGDNQGDYITDPIKFDNLNSKVLLYSAIAKVLQENKKPVGEKIQLIVGLPSGQYDKLKQKKKESLLDKEDKEVIIKLDGEFISFHIEKVIVLPQCSGLFLIEELQGEYLGIDFGGMTIDVTEFSDGQPNKKRSYPMGMQTIYAKLIDDVYSKYGAIYKIHRGEELLRDRIVITENGELPYDPSEIIKKHIEELIKQHIVLDFPQYFNVKKKWFGGGAAACREWINEDIEEDTIFTNVKIFYMVGADTFGES